MTETKSVAKRALRRRTGNIEIISPELKKRSVVRKGGRQDLLDNYGNSTRGRGDLAWSRPKIGVVATQMKPTRCSRDKGVKRSTERMYRTAGGNSRRGSGGSEK